MAQAIARPMPSAASTRARPVLLLSFVWMFGGLIVATLAARWSVESGAMMRFAASNQWFWLISLLIWIAISFFFGTLVQRVPAPVGALLFALYAAWTGLSLSLTVQAYAPAAVWQAFVASAVLFGTMVVFALLTKMDLLKYTFYIFAAVIALLVMSLLNWFVFRSAGLDWWLTIIGIALFAISTANGVQQIVRMNLVGDPAMRLRLSIVGAMILFTNFINIFIRILALTGRR